MLSFIGEYACSVDNKYRVVVPSVFRKEVQKAGQTVFVIRKNIFECCVDAYSFSQWESMVADLKQRLNFYDRSQAAFFRTFYAGAQEVELDANGRILLPKRMLEEVGIKKEMVFSGQDAKIEIWEPGAYDRAKLSEADFSRIIREIV